MIEKKEETKKKPVFTQFKPDTTFTISVREMAMLEQALEPFKWMSALLENSKNIAANNGYVVEVYEEDIEKNEDGSLKKDQNGFYVLQEDFWDKHKTKEKVINLSN